MQNETLKRQLEEANRALERGMFTRLCYTFLIQALIKQHPNPKAAFNDTIKNMPSFKVFVTDLADLLELDLDIEE